MLRLVLAVMFLGIWLPCFSEEISQDAKDMNLQNERLALVYIGCGNENLLSHNYSSSLEDFQRASSLLDKQENSYLELDFLIFFGKAIAYDNLGSKDQCQSSMASLFFILTAGENEGDDIESNATKGRLPKEYEDADEFMKKLAALAPSPNVRDFLLSIVDEMSEELLPSFKIADPTPLGRSDWKYYDRDTASIEFCKSHFWKRMGKMTKKIYTAVMKAKEVWDFIKDIDETLKKN